MMRIPTYLAVASLIALSDPVQCQQVQRSEDKRGKDHQSKHGSFSDKKDYDHDSEVMLWYLEAARGTWFGFYRGFFHDNKKPQS